MSELICLTEADLTYLIKEEKQRHEQRKEQLSQARYFVMAKGNSSQREAAEK